MRLNLLLVNCLFADFVREGEQIVKDYDSGLMWTDYEVLSKSWVEAITYCENLIRNGSADWRLPNIQELLSLSRGKEVLNESYGNSLNKIFVEGSTFNEYWSSTRSDYILKANYGTLETSSKTYEKMLDVLEIFN